MRTTGRRRSWVPRPAPWFLRLLIVVLLVHISVNVTRPMMSYRALELGVPPAYLGLVSAAFALVPLIVGIGVGRRVDRLGPRRFQVAGAVLLAASGLGLGFASALAWVVVLFAVCGLGHLLVVVAVQTTVANESGPDVIDRRFGHFTFVAALGQLIGPVLGGLVAGAAGVDGTRWALLVAGVVALLALPPALAIPAEAGRAHRAAPSDESIDPAEARPDEAADLRSVLATPGLIGSLLVSFVVISASDTLVVYLPALGEERGLSVQAVSALLAARAAATMVSRIGLGWLVAKVGRLRLLFGSVAVAGLAIAALPFTPTFATAMAPMVVAGFALGVCQPLTMAWVASETTAANRGTAMSVRIAANRLGQVSVPAAAGLVAGFAGTAGVLWVSGAAVVGTAAYVRRAWPPK